MRRFGGREPGLMENGGGDGWNAEDKLSFGWQSKKKKNGRRKKRCTLLRQGWRTSGPTGEPVGSGCGGRGRGRGGGSTGG